MHDIAIDDNSVMGFAPHSQSMPLVESTSQLQSGSGYQLLPEEPAPIDQLYRLLSTVDIHEADLKQMGISQNTLLRLYQQETGRLSWLKWCKLDHGLEKILQWLCLSHHDLNPESKLPNRWKRVWPAERSILLKNTWGLIKAYSIQGFSRGLETTLFTATHLFIYTMLLYRLTELMRTGQFTAEGFRESFIGSEQNGIDSLVHLLYKIDSKWLKLILTSPLIIGALQGIASGIGNYVPLSVHELVVKIDRQLLHRHWLQDSIYECLPLISSSSRLSLSGKFSKLATAVRWDGRLSDTERKKAFEVISRGVKEGRKLVRTHALQEIAKIAHGMGLKDLTRLRISGYSKQELLMVLLIKCQALDLLESFVETENLSSKLWKIYQQYLLWWLRGLKAGSCRQQFPAFTLKISKLVTELHFAQSILLSILAAIACPNRVGFIIGFGYDTIYANKFTKECYVQLVDNFRTVNSSDPVDSLTQQTQKFDLRNLDSLELWFKNLTGQEMVSILQSAERQGAYFKNIYIYQDITDQDMKDLAGYLKNSTTIEGIELGCQDSVIGGGESITNQGFKYLTQVLPFMQQLTYLRFCFPGIDDAGMEELANVVNQTQINSYNIHNNASDDSLVKFVKALAPMSIQQLDLSCYPMGDATIKELSPLVKNNPGLIQLRVDGNLITNGGMEIFAEMLINSSLQIVGARGTGITDEGLIAVANVLPTMPFLTNLAIGSRSGDSGILAIINQLNKINLNWFEFWFNSFSISSMQAFAVVLPTTSIQQLVFGHNNLNDSAIVSIFAKGVHDSSVTELAIFNNDVSKSASALCPALSRLKTLQIEQGNLTDDGLINLAPCLRSSPVTQIGLPVNQIGDKGLNALTSILPYTGVSYIDLQQNNITDSGAQPFADIYPCTQLKSVYLMGNLISSNILSVVQNFQLINYCQEQLCHADVQYNGNCGSLNQSLNLMSSFYMNARTGFLTILIQSTSAKGATMMSASLLCAYAVLKISRSAMNFFRRTKNNCSNSKASIKLPKYSSLFYRKPAKINHSNCLKKALHRLGIC